LIGDNARIFLDCWAVHCSVMSPTTKLRVANVLMLVGVIPLALGLAWIISVLSWARQHQGQAGGSDAFLMMGVLLVTYLFAFVVSGGSALWSVMLVKRNGGIRARTARVLRWFTGVVLLVPFLWYLGVTFSLL
jgi:hypothetical protein